MIIALSGHIKSGKNTVANIIQYLTSSFVVESKLPFDPNTNYEIRSQWQQKAFAGKLKQIVSLLTGIPVEDLDKQEVKESVLGEEWWKWELELDGPYGTISLPYLNTPKKKLNQYEGLELIKPTVRSVLQELGTELLRNQLHPDVHINALFSEYIPFSKRKAHDLQDFSELYNHTACKSCGKPYSGYKRQYLCKECIEDSSIQFYPNWIISDVRFPNELEAIKKRNGITIRIDRNLYKGNARIAKIPHISETALDSYQGWDFFIDNTGTLEELIEKVKIILQKLKII